MNLKNKKVLITAGPTWVAVDKVRVISNIATGELGSLLAEEFYKNGSQVSMFLGPVSGGNINKKISITGFKFFDEFKRKITSYLKSQDCDILIHTAAVSDYKPKRIQKSKIDSGIKELKLVLEPTVKIIDAIKKLAPRVFLIGFKFEPDASRQILLKEAGKLKSRSKLDMVVANTIINDKRYQAYIIYEGKITGPLLSKKALAVKLAGVLKKI